MSEQKNDSLMTEAEVRRAIGTKGEKGLSTSWAKDAETIVGGRSAERESSCQRGALSPSYCLVPEGGYVAVPSLIHKRAGGKGKRRV